MKILPFAAQFFLSDGQT